MATPLGLKPAAVLLLLLALAIAAYLYVQAQDKYRDESLLAVCQSIPDPDRRQHCLALTVGQTEPCDAMQNADMCYFCRAQVSENTSECASIKDASWQQQCTDMLRQQPPANDPQ